MKATATKKAAAQSAKKPTTTTKATPSKKGAAAKVKGVTEMTREKHNFEGFAVRSQKGSYHFRQYVSAAVSKFPAKTTEKSAKDQAHKKAVECRLLLEEIVSDKKSWRGEELTKAARTRIEAAGFTVAVKAA